MSFSADWLALREPYDTRARNPVVLDAVAAAFASRGAITVVDLACGTGSTLRAISGRLPRRQTWRMIDNDLGLLARAAAAGRGPDLQVAGVPIDLARDLELALDGDIDLVTTSALIDLVSADWLERLIVEAATRGLPVYAALSYDGRAELTPRDAEDARIVDAVNRHQRRDKGFGPALGPAAVDEALLRFARVGYEVTQGRSDWDFAPHDREIQLEVLSGWASAAREMDDVKLPDVVGWLTRRRDHVAAGRATLRVGHVDIFARPIGTR
jgi:hypothetical protein